LGLGVEQGLAAAGTAVDAGHLAVVVLAGEGTLGATQPADVELGVGKLVAPGFQGFLDLFHGVHLRGRKKPGLYLFRASGRTYHASLLGRQSVRRVTAGTDRSFPRR